MQKIHLTSPVALEVTQSMVAEPPGSGTKTEKVPHEWLKLFSAEWTLCGIIEARMESETKVILKNWIHKTHVEEVVNEMIEGIQKATQINALWWLEELLQPKRYISQLSRNRKDLAVNIRIKTLENLTKIFTSALVDSGCTSSTINQVFVEQHNIPTHAVAMPIPALHGESNILA